MARAVKLFRKSLLLLLTIASVFIGIGVGFAFRQTKPSQMTIELVGFPGEILMNMLKCLIVPLIAASLISGLSQLDARQSGRMGLFAFSFYVTTMSLAVATGIVLVIMIHPGDKSIKLQAGLDNPAATANISALEKTLDLLRNMFPPNIIQATFQQIETEYVAKTIHSLEPNSSAITVMKAVNRHVDGMNVLGMIVFFVATGVVMGSLGARAKPLADLFMSLDAVISCLVGIIMWYSPIGIASLIAAKILEISDLAKTAKMLGAYMFTVILGLSIQCFFTLPLIHYIATHQNPYIYMKGLTQAAMTAIGTASSAASLPVTFRCLEENNGIKPIYTKFVLPIGSIVNMDGTALYEAVASIFIAQINGMELGIAQIITISITSTLAAIGAASIPSAGLVTMLIVLTSVGLPSNDVATIIAVDWLLDRLRTAVNVMGDSYACGFVQAMMERRYGKIGPADGDTDKELPCLAELDTHEMKSPTSLESVEVNGAISIRVNDSK